MGEGALATTTCSGIGGVAMASSATSGEGEPLWSESAERGIFFRKQLRKKALGDFFRGSSDNFVGVGSHRRVWRGKRPPKFSGKNMWRVDGEAVARQYLLMNQTPAKSAVACQTLAWQSLSGKQTAPKNPQIASSCSHCVASISLEILTV
jgi:hypothetical protein